MLFSQLPHTFLRASTALASPPARRDTDALLRTGSIEAHDSALKQQAMSRRAEVDPWDHAEVTKATEEGWELGKRVWCLRDEHSRGGRIPSPKLEKSSAQTSHFYSTGRLPVSAAANTTTYLVGAGVLEGGRSRTSRTARG